MWTFCSLLVAFLAPSRLEKFYATRKISTRKYNIMLNHRIRSMYFGFKFELDETVGTRYFIVGSKIASSWHIWSISMKFGQKMFLDRSVFLKHKILPFLCNNKIDASPLASHILIVLSPDAVTRRSELLGCQHS